MPENTVSPLVDLADRLVLAASFYQWMAGGRRELWFCQNPLGQRFHKFEASSGIKRNRLKLIWRYECVTHEPELASARAVNCLWHKMEPIRDHMGFTVYQLVLKRRIQQDIVKRFGYQARLRK